jgi:hypothetical protein
MAIKAVWLEWWEKRRYPEEEGWTGGSKLEGGIELGRLGQ